MDYNLDDDVPIVTPTVQQTGATSGPSARVELVYARDARNAE